MLYFLLETFSIHPVLGRQWILKKKTIVRDNLHLCFCSFGPLNYISHLIYINIYHLHLYFLQFRTGAFSTGNTVQPVALRLECFSIEDSTLVLKWSYSTFSNRFPNSVDTLTWARYQSRSPKLLFLQTLLTPVNSPVKSFVIILTLFSGDICVHWILARRHSNGGGAFGPKNLFKSGECLSLLKKLCLFFLCCQLPCFNSPCFHPCF